MLIDNVKRLDWKKIASLEPNILGKHNFLNHTNKIFIILIIDKYTPQKIDKRGTY